MKARLFLLLLLCSWTPSAWAYEQTVTHRDMTARAIENSALLKDSGLQKDLGLYPMKACPHFPPGNSVVIATSPLCQLEQGAIDEDDLPNPQHHFYDPVNNRPLTILGKAVGNTSPDWSLEDKGPISSQAYSYLDARRHMKQALLGPSAQREAEWKAVFEALGHVVHHVQDMAQPQHVRNDAHFSGLGITRSRYEQYTHDKPDRVLDLARDAGAVFPGRSPGTSEFKLPRDFWKNAAITGIAEYTNRTFVSQDSNFINNPLGEPRENEEYGQPAPTGSKDYTLEELYPLGESVPVFLQLLCRLGVDCKMKMISTRDLKKASTYSIFDQDLNVQFGTRIYALNRFNFDEAHTVLIPKAVSYSAGLINYFFRGRLEITPPDGGKGAYAVVNHTAGAGDGFTTLKATVKNTTPGESLLGGKLVAVVKYHLNQCYTPDLKGEFTKDPADPKRWRYPQCKPGQLYRTEQEYTLQAKEQDLTLSSGVARELTFQFPSPIPFGATDVYLQVVYTGTMGSEPDSIAVGTADLSEPTYTSVFNATDVFVLPDGGVGKFFLVREIIDENNIKNPPYSLVDSNGDGSYASPPDMEIRGGSMKVELYLDGPGGTYKKIATVDALPEGRFLRIVLLLKPGTFNVSVSAVGAGFNSFNTYSWPTSTSQLEWDESSRKYSYHISSLYNLRKEQSRQWNALAYYRRYGAYNADVLTLPASGATNATQPFDAEISR